MVRACCALEGRRLRLRTEDSDHTVDLDRYQRVLLLGVGKASVGMGRGIVDLLGPRLTDGLLVTKEAPAAETEAAAASALGPVTVLEAGHPVPDERSSAAAERMLELAEGADEHTLVLIVISGGGSALLSAPWAGEHPIELSDKQRTTELLLRSGADIRELNTVRKHLSAVKGGRLAAALHPARTVSLILSDIVGDPLDAIASGPTVADPTTYEDAASVLERYGLQLEVPSAVFALVEAGRRGDVPDTPKPGDPVLGAVTNVLLGTNLHGLRAAIARAEELGYRVLSLGSRISGEAREVAKVFTGIAADVAARGVPIAPPACIIAGGETTVTVRGTGKGGRNQEQALAALAEMQREPELFERVSMLFASTDGNDGPTDAAGAWADPAFLESAAAAGLAPAELLANNDAYTFFDGVKGLLRTGATGTNVCDYQITLVDAP
jgi:hydroxypyruvate reductase